MKKLSYFFVMIGIGSLILISSCKEDEPTPAETPDPPTVAAPGIQSVQVNQSIDITFNVTIPGGYASSTVTASSGSASVSSAPSAGATSGGVVVSYTAGGSAEAASVTLTVTDNASQSSNQNATVNITEEPVAAMVDVIASLNGVGTTTWTNDNIYVLRGFIFVNDGQTLTIEPGTVIKGQPGQGAGASALIVARGGKIMAEGTAEAPIIFTGLSDDLAGSVPDDANALWGGLILLGKATNNNNDTGNEKNIEGIPTEDARGIYGGTADDDNSGILTYVSVRHGGSLIGSDNEINGITFGSVGSGTTISNIEVFSNLDDGVEFFGGKVNVTNLILSYPGDDGIDIDEGYSGSIQNAVIWHTGSTLESDDPNGCELDGAGGDNEPELPYALPQLANITVIYDDVDGFSMNRAIYMRDNFGGSFFNSIFMGHDAPFDIERRTDKLDGNTDPQSSYHRFANGDAVLNNNLFYDINGVTDGVNFADIFALSDEEDATLESDLETEFALTNLVSDPVFGSGTTKFTPTGADVKTNLATGLPGGLQDLGYKGGVDPDAAAPFFADWSLTWQVISNQ